MFAGVLSTLNNFTVTCSTGVVSFTRVLTVQRAALTELTALHAVFDELVKQILFAHVIHWVLRFPDN